MLSNDEIKALREKVEEALGENRPVTPPWHSTIVEVESAGVDNA
jgi:hypothetical protein